MKKFNTWKMLAMAGSFVVLTNGQLMDSYASMKVPDEGYVVDGTEECRRLLMEVVSGAEYGLRQEILVTGKDYEPESLTIAQMFPDAVNISNTVLKEYQKGGNRYVTCRIGFEKRHDEEENPEIEDGDPIGRYWSVGDRKTWEIGGERYIFRCIDDDYGSNSEYQTCALFLCETVIRSDVDSTESKREILTFGRTNNYKTSEVRMWLQKNLDEEKDGIVPVNTGVNYAYLGATVEGTYQEGLEESLWQYELDVQNVKDELFLLSLEEAMEYRDVLWDIEGESAAFRRGYWLRTPVYTESENQFTYGDQIYVVDLDRGCIRPADVQDGSIGIRPAFCLPQGWVNQ